MIFVTAVVDGSNSAPLVIAAIALVGVVIAPLITAKFVSKQRDKEKAQDYARQDEVATAAAEVAEHAADTARLLKEANEKFEQRQTEVAQQVAAAAKLLEGQQEAVAAQAREVARLLADDGSGAEPVVPGRISKFRNMGVDVTLSFKSGARQDAVLVGVPQIGERIRMDRVDMTLPALIVEDVIWMEALSGQPPHVIVFVKPCASAVPVNEKGLPK